MQDKSTVLPLRDVSSPEMSSARSEGARSDAVSVQAVPSAALPVDRSVPSVDLREMLRILWRRRWLIGATAVGCVLVTGLVLSQITPRYTATAQVLVDPRQTNVVDIEQVLSGLPANAETIQSEMEVISSRNLAMRVVDRLKLSELPEFNPTLNGGQSAWLGWLRRDSSATAPDAVTQNRVVDTFLSRLTVKVAGRSRVIDVSFVSTDPALAASVANTVAELYLTEQMESKFEATRRASAWLSDRLEQLRIDAEAAELAAARFKAENTGAASAPRAAADDHVRQLAADTLLARTSIDESRNRLAQLTALRDQPFRVDASWPTDALRLLAEQVESLSTQRDDLAHDLGPRHPRMVEASAKVEAARKQLTDTLAPMITAATAALSEAEQKLVDLQAESARASNMVSGSNEAVVRLRTLEREALASRALFETFLTRFKQTSEQEGLAQADARQISSASVPVEASFPNNRLLMLLSVVAGLGLGVVLAFVAEQLDNGFRSADQIESLLGLPTIGHIPALKSLGVKDMTPDAYVSSKPTSSYAEALRMVRTSLLLSLADQPPRVLVVTSALPGEGKTTTILSLARLAAMSGEKVIVVDADLRRPRVHSALALENTAGVTELLCGLQSFEQVLRQSKQGETGFDVITAGKATPHATELMRSQQMKQLLRKLSASYSLVLVDSPPVLPVADAKVLSTFADAVLYVVRWQDTPRETATYAVKQLREVNAKLAGAVLNAVDIRRQSEYGYGDGGYYYGRYRKYYND